MDEVFSVDFFIMAKVGNFFFFFSNIILLQLLDSFRNCSFYLFNVEKNVGVYICLCYLCFFIDMHFNLM